MSDSKDGSDKGKGSGQDQEKEAPRARASWLDDEIKPEDRGQEKEKQL
jgi:hypothetical protein